jgi:uncharacterized protein YbdZ (MbtH family)
MYRIIVDKVLRMSAWPADRTAELPSGWDLTGATVQSVAVLREIFENDFVDTTPDAMHSSDSQRAK